MRVSTIFVSYANADRDYVEAVIAHAEALTRRRLTFFRADDPDSIRPGDEWRDRIVSQMDRAAVAIFFVTPNSIARPWVNFELGYLAKSATPRICVAAKNLDLAKVTGPIGVYQLVTFSDVPKLAAQEIMRFLTHHLPAPARRAQAIQVAGMTFSIDQGWQRYISSGKHGQELNRGTFGVTFGKTFDDDGFRYPQSQDSLSAPWEYLAVGASPNQPVHVYFVTEMYDRSLIKLYVNSTQDSVGYGNPSNEFQIPIPAKGRPALLLIDVSSFAARMGKQPRIVRGLRVRAPSELSFIGMFEKLESVPARFKNRKALRIALPE